MKNHLYLHRELSKRLKELPDDSSTKQFLSTLQCWLKARTKRFSNQKSVKDWGLDGYAALPLEDYPTERSPMDAPEEVRSLICNAPLSLDSFAMVLSGCFWQGITLESSVTCPNCESAALRYLYDERKDALVLECERCGWTQMPDGRSWQGQPPLRPPTTDVLDRLLVNLG